MLRLEHLSLRVLSADLCVGPELASAVGVVATSLPASAGGQAVAEPEVAWIGAECRVSRLRRSATVGSASGMMPRDGTFVITGGLGGLGLRAASLLAASGVSSSPVG